MAGGPIGSRQEARKSQKGFILLLTLIFMVALTIMVGALLYMVTYEARDMAAQMDDYKLLNLAGSGVERGHRAIRDFFTTSPQTMTADLRGGSTTGSTSVTNPGYMRHIDATAATLATTTATMANTSARALLRTFDSNYTNTKITSVQVRVRASRATGGSATLQVSYSTSAIPSYTTLITWALPNSTTPSENSATLPNPGPSGWDWTTLTTGLMNPNLILRAVYSSGNRTIYLDAMYLRVTYQTVTPPANWATGAYTIFPINLYGAAGNGQIESARIGEGGNLTGGYYEETTEQGKVHLNYASQLLLSNLMTELGIASARASTLASNIITYRGTPLTNPFNSVEELKQVSTITQAEYDMMKNFVTVYSFANKSTQRSGGAGNYRAPVNINTAPRQVLEAVFDPLSIGATDAASLATDIISQRSSSPFKGFYYYASLASDNTYLYNFINNRAYLTAAERLVVLDNADASLIPAGRTAASPNAVTTEFCYTADACKINSLANIYAGDAARVRRLRVNTVRGGMDGRRVLEIYDSGTPPAVSAGYRKENYE